MRPLSVKPLEDIFTERYLPLYGDLYGIAAAIVGTGDAADAVQEAMVKIWKNGETMAAATNPRGYAVTVLRTTAIDMLRRRHDTDALDNARQLTSAPQPEPDTAEFLERAIATLSVNQQEVFRLSAFGDMTADEIAATTGLSAANVRQLLSRSRKKIRELYTKYMQS